MADLILEYTADLAKFRPKQCTPGAQLTMIAMAHSITLQCSLEWLITNLPFINTTWLAYVQIIGTVMSEDLPLRASVL
jgi:hypothetical protein